MEGALYINQGNAGLKLHSDMKSLSPSLNFPGGYNIEWIKNATLNSLGRQWD